jgi:hypothetical protein
MNNKLILYIGLLVLVVAIIGGGLWFLLNPESAIDIPDSDPIISMHKSYRTIGTGPDHLYIYEDGTIIYTEERGEPDDGEKTWYTGKLQAMELEEILDYITESSFEEIDENNEFPGEEVNGATKTGGMACTFFVNYGELSKRVSADFYISPDGGKTYPDMPYPLDEIYKRLQSIIDNEAEEVHRESI